VNPLTTGVLYFAPGQHENFVRLIVVRTPAELLAAVERWSGEKADADALAYCCFDHSSMGPNHGFLIFSTKHLTRAIVVHECLHAAFNFVGQHVMKSAECVAMGEEEAGTYCEEAIANVIEKLFEQADALLWPV